MTSSEQSFPWAGVLVWIVIGAVVLGVGGPRLCGVFYREGPFGVVRSVAVGASESECARCANLMTAEYVDHIYLTIRDVAKCMEEIKCARAPLVVCVRDCLKPTDDRWNAAVQRCAKNHACLKPYADAFTSEMVRCQSDCSREYPGLVAR